METIKKVFQTTIIMILALSIALIMVNAESIDWVRPQKTSFESITLNGSTIHNWNSLNITQSEFWYNNSNKVSTLNDLPVDVNNYVDSTELRGNTIKVGSVTGFTYAETSCNTIGQLGHSCKGTSSGIGNYVNVFGTNNVGLGNRLMINETTSASVVISSGVRNNMPHARLSYATYILSTGDNSGDNPTISIGDDDPDVDRINIDVDNFGGLRIKNLPVGTSFDDFTYILNIDKEEDVLISKINSDVWNTTASLINEPSFWVAGTSAGHIWYNASSGVTMVGIGKQPTTTLDINGNVTIRDTLAVNDETGLKMTYKTGVTASIKPFSADGKKGLRLYDSIETKYAELGLGYSGSNLFFNLWIDETQMMQLHKNNNLARFYSVLTSSRYYPFGHDYGFNLNSNNIGLNYREVVCRGADLSLTPNAGYTYLVRTDGEDCNVVLANISSNALNKIVFNIKNVDTDGYPLYLYTTAGNTIDYTYNNTNAYTIRTYESVQLHATTQDFFIIGKVI